ncbi:MAG: sigma 54-interacting transcriptional regulator, partial [Bacillota bacterium]
MRYKIILMSNFRLTEVINNNLPPELKEEVKIINARFDKVLPLSRKLIEGKQADVIIARNSHVYILKEYFEDTIPLIEINISIADILKLINENMGDKIAIVNYKKPIEELYENLLSNPPRQVVFDSIHDLRKKMENLKTEGYESIIGTSAVCDVAEEYKLKPLFIYSNKAVIEAVERAKKIISVQSIENERKNQLKAIINYVYSGIIYVDNNGLINFFNPIAEKILNISAEEATGKHIEKVLPDSRYDQVIKVRNAEINQYTKIKNNVVLISRIPIKVKDVIRGVLITFQDVEEIKKSELKIREKSYEKGLRAKYTFNDIIGDSEIMNRKKTMAQAYAKSNENILIKGETGTGKEIFAQSIHNFSPRSDKPFVAINCAALPPNLLESELFGYEKGAFTGAKREGQPGKFELAHQGTIFLDEIGKMPRALQPKILRVIE